MKKFLNLTALFCLLLSFTMQLNAADTRHYEIVFDEFHELKVVDGINVDYIHDPSRAGKVEFDADATVASAVIFTPSKGKLSVSLASREVSYSNLPTVRVYSSFLSSVRNEGDSTVRVISSAAVPKLSAKLIGNGNISIRSASCTELNAEIISGKGLIAITGTGTSAKFSVTGAGSIQADDFKAQEVSAVVTGTGSIACYALKELSVGGLGSGVINYRGAPKIKKKLISSVRVNSSDLGQ